MTTSISARINSNLSSQKLLKEKCFYLLFSNSELSPFLCGYPSLQSMRKWNLCSLKKGLSVNSAAEFGASEKKTIRASRIRALRIKTRRIRLFTRSYEVWHRRKTSPNKSAPVRQSSLTPLATGSKKKSKNTKTGWKSNVKQKWRDSGSYNCSESNLLPSSRLSRRSSKRTMSPSTI
jgi:hypothetical protein